VALTISIASEADLRALERARRQLDQFGAQSQTTAQRLNQFGSRMAGAGKKMSMFSAGAAAGLAVFAKSALDAAVESEVAVARLDQIAESMGVLGPVLGGSTERLTGFADTLQHTIGVEDEAIIQTQSLLLTFGEVAKSAGEAGGAFDRATVLAFDLAKAGFGSAEGNAKMLGKALNDPVKGLTALGRAGVTFTEAQKEQIKALVESGDTAKAQQIILAEVEKQVGGTAAATATGAEKMRVAFAAFTEQLGVALLPIMQQVQAFLLENVLPVLQGLFERFQNLDPTIQKVIIGVGLLALAIGPLLVIVGTMIPAFTAVAGVLGAAAAPILGIVAAVALLVAGFVLLYQRSETFRTAVQEAFQQIRAVISMVIDQIRGKLQEHQAELTMVISVLRKVGDFLVQNVFPVLVQFWSIYLQGVVRVLGFIITGLIDVIAKFIQFVAQLIATGVAIAAWVVTTVEQLTGFFTAVRTALEEAFGAVGEFIQGVFLGIVEGVRDAVRRVILLLFKAINEIITLYNRLQFQVPKIDLGVLGSIGPFSVDFPDIPLLPVPNLGDINALGDGGLVLGPTLALIGEAGPEMVVPLDRAGGMGGNTFHITVNAGMGTDGADVGRRIVDAIRKYERFSGPVFVAA